MSQKTINQKTINRKTEKQSKKTKGKKKQSIIREYSEAILFALVAALILRIFVVQAFRIPTGSMENTLLVGDFLLVNKFIYGVRTPDKIPFIDVAIPWFRLPGFTTPDRGDVVVFKYPENPDQDYIKRCVAIGGDTVEIRSKKLYVNGEFVPYPPNYKVNNFTMQPGQPEPGIKPVGAGNKDNYGPVVVPQKHYFMLGDHRDNSLDSRYWGFLPEENIVGEAMIIYFSWDKTAKFYQLFKMIRWGRIANIIH